MRGVYQGFTTSANGDIITGATVEVRTSGGSLASIYAAASGGSPIANPLTVDSDGFFRFYADQGRYSIAAFVGVNQIAEFEDVDIAALGTAAVVDTGPGLTQVPTGQDLEAINFRTVQDILASTTSLYDYVPVGGVVVAKAQGFSYELAPLGVMDADLVTAGGVLLYALPTSAGHYNFDSMNPAKDGVTDDYPKLKKLLDKPVVGNVVYGSGASVFFPDGTYYMGQTINLKHVHHLFGNASGMPFNVGAALRFPADTSGIIVNRFNTLGNTTVSPTTTAADGSIIEGLTLYGDYVSDTEAHGLRLRARAKCRNLTIAGFGGNGVHVSAAQSGANPENIGNANLFHLETIRSDENGGWGVFIDLADVNAGVAIGLNCGRNGTGGVFDSSFLGNTHIAHHVNANGTQTAGYNTERNRTATVFYDGGFYNATPGATEAQLIATAPGTNAAVWTFRQSGSAPSEVSPLWEAGQAVGRYIVGYAYRTDNVNAKNVFLGCYSEAGTTPSDFEGPTLCLGGSMSAPVRGGILNMTTSGSAEARGFVAVSAGAGNESTVVVGGVPGQALQFSGSDNAGGSSTGVWRLRREGDGWRLNVNNGGLVMELTGPTDINPLMFRLPVMAFGVGSDARKFGRWSGNTVPASGSFNKGDAYLYASPNAGAFAGFYCTTTGIAGSTAVFKQFGAIEA